MRRLHKILHIWRVVKNSSFIVDQMTAFVLLLLLLLLGITQSSVITANPKYIQNIGAEFEVFPFLEGITEFSLENVVITIFPDDGDVRTLCLDKTSVLREPSPNDGKEYKHALFIKIVAGCFPSKMANVLAKKNFSTLLVRDKFYPAGLAATSLWAFGENFPIPVAQISSTDGDYFQNGTIVNLNNAKSGYQSAYFLGYAIFFDVIFGMLCVIQLYLGIDRLINNLRATKYKITTSGQVLLLEIFEGLVKRMFEFFLAPILI
jgi:hypothetical protein